MRLLFIMIEAGLFAFLFYLIVTQLVIPLSKGTSLFPAFDKKERQLTSEEVELASEIERRLREERLEQQRNQKEQEQ